MRDFTSREAQKLSLTGWCRNVLGGDRKGQVEIVAEGPNEQLDAFIAWIRAGGSPHARVDDVQIDYASTTGEFSSFQVIKSSR